MRGSALHREDLFTDQAEAQMFFESAEDLTDFIGAGKHYLLDVVKHPLRGFLKHVPPDQSWNP
jgi:hypothetical protein